MKILKDGTVTSPKGFRANGVVAGIKRSGKRDLALIVSDIPANSAAVFTKNSIKAAPLIVSQKNMRNGKIQAIVANSGNANCFTGKFGLIYAQRTTEIVAQYLGIAAGDVVVASTGIIGRPLPFKKIRRAVKGLVVGLGRDAGLKAAEAILTTDTKVKTAAVTVMLGAKKITIGACAKGSGMIAPDMATMLSFITTDAAITRQMLKMALRHASDQTFNNITVDGCMSTNDMVVVMANGLANNEPIAAAGPDFQKFTQALHWVCLNLAKKIVLDGEGATKFIEIQVTGGQNHAQAKRAGLAVANSVLVKTAAFGSNPNWGRVAAAVGSLGIPGLGEDSLKIKFSNFSCKDIVMAIDLNQGRAKATVYTCDLSYAYVKINGEYN